MLDLLLFWASTYAQVFALGFQSRNVNTGRYAYAGFTSLVISAGQLVTVRGIVNNDPWVVMLLSGSAGSAGVISAMLFSKHAIEKRRKQAV